MANEQSKRQSERQGGQQSSATGSSAIEHEGGGERGVAARQYQDPVSLFDSLFERMQREFFGTSLLNAMIPSHGEGHGGRLARMPRIQMHDTGDALELTAEMPGIDGRNVSVRLEDDVLTISGEQRQEDQGEGMRTQHYHSLYRQVPLPGDIDSEACQASYRDGVLTLHFPKARERSNAREIPVTTQQGGQQQTGQQQTGQQQGGQEQKKERAA